MEENIDDSIQHGRSVEQLQTNQQQHQQQQQHKHREVIDAVDKVLKNKFIFFGLVIAIFIIAIYLRTGLLGFQGLFEPDGFFYYTAIKQAVANHYIVSRTVTLSGYPWHNGLNEAPGLLYFTLVPYFFLRFFGVQLIDVMRTVSIFFGILDAILAYLLVRYMAKSRFLGLLAMFFVAANSGNIARTAGGVYRGDTFITFFAMAALIFMLMALNEEDKNKSFLWIGLAGFLAGTGNFIWNGGVFVPMLYFAVLLVVITYSAIADDRSALWKSFLLAVALILAWLLANLLIIIGLAHTSIFTGTTFLAVIVGTAAASIAAYYILEKKLLGAVTSRLSHRFVLVVCLAAIAVILALLFAGPFVESVITNGGSVYQQNNIAQTTQELQPPTYGFLFASFGLELWLAPIGVLLFIFFAHLHGNETNIRRGRLALNVNYGFIVILAYFLIAAYLQGGAIRYNSIVSVPLALFSAYAIYTVYKIAEPYSINLSNAQIKIGYVLIALTLVLLLYQFLLTQAQSFTSYQADGVNPQFLQAMDWISQNTPANSTFLDLWPDGSLVEGWGNRTSFQDSVGGENATRILQFGQFIFNTSINSQYLINNAHRPNYLLVRNFWFQELGGIAIEANITQNLSRFGYNVLTSFNAYGNATEQIYQFGSNSYTAQLLVEPQANGTRRILALLGPAGATQQQLTPIAHVLFFNSSNENYSLQSSTSQNALNYTLLVSFTGRNITSAAIMGQELPFTNLFKFIFECGYTQCSYGNKNVSAQLVYANADSKIIEFTYNNST